MGQTRRAIVKLLAITGLTGQATASDGDDYGVIPYAEGGYGGARSDCFIATAAIGTTNHESVVALRRFRDEVLLQHRIGRALVRLYYAVSPPIARWISRGHRRRTIVRWLLVAPTARFVGRGEDR